MVGWQQAKELDAKYDLRGKAVAAGNATASAAQVGWQRAKELDARYDIRGNAARIASATVTATQAGWQKISGKKADHTQEAEE